MVRISPRRRARPVTIPTSADAITTSRERCAKPRSRSGRRLIERSRRRQQAGCVDRELGPALARLRRRACASARSRRGRRRRGGSRSSRRASMPSMSSRPMSVRTIVSVQSLNAPMPPVEMSACSAAKSGHMLAALARPRVALLERHLVVVAVVHPDLEDALDVHLLACRPSSGRTSPRRAPRRSRRRTSSSTAARC